MSPVRKSSPSPSRNSPPIAPAKAAAKSLGGVLPLTGSGSAEKVIEVLVGHDIGHWKKPGGTDKEQLASGEAGPGHHSYGVIYQEIIEKLSKKAPVETVLEIGVQRGGSLLLWQGLCPAATVVGIDVDDQISENVHKALDKARCEILWGNAYAEEMVSTVKRIAPGGFDLIIDDGPHDLESQKTFLRLYLPLLKKGGVAVIEDIQDESALDALEKETGTQYKTQKIDRRNINGRWDDLMLIIERRALS
jgi:predicted O-methyltransferase YrrM